MYMFSGNFTYLLLGFVNIHIIFEIKFKTSIKSEHNYVTLNLNSNINLLTPFFIFTDKKLKRVTSNI